MDCDKELILEWPIHGDARGNLVAIEENASVPFAIRRVYYLYATAMGTSRGFHAHRTLQQVLVCIAGSCTVHLDNGIEQRQINLSSPAAGLLVGPMMWHEMHDFSPDCILLVVASEHYCEEDYIRSYRDFAEIVSRNQMQNQNFGES